MLHDMYKNIKRVEHHGAEHHAGEDPRVKDVYTRNVNSDTKKLRTAQDSQEPQNQLQNLSQFPPWCSLLRQVRRHVLGSTHQVTTSQRCRPCCPRWGRRHRWTDSAPSIPKAPSATPKMPHKIVSNKDRNAKTHDRDDN